MLFAKRLPKPDPLRAALRAAIRMDETRCVEERLAEAMLAPDARDRIDATARQLVEELRRRTQGAGGLDAFMAEYELSSEEGVVPGILSGLIPRPIDECPVAKLAAATAE